MPWNNGIFTRSNGEFGGSTVWQTDRDAGHDIEADRHDNHDQDIANGINACLPRDGSASMVAPLDMGGFTIQNLAPAQLGSELPQLGQTIQTVTFTDGILTLGRTTSPDFSVDLTGLGSATGGVFATTKAQISAMTGLTLNQCRFLVSDDSADLFKWNTADLSVKVSLDSLGNYIAPDSDTTGASGAWELVEPAPLPLTDGLYEAEDSGELFTLPNGINEFELLYVGGLYHLFYDDKTQTKHRQAATIAGLSSASDDLTQSGRYPSVFYDGTTWHLYSFDQGANRTKHYTSSSASGPYALQDSLPVGYADFALARDPDSGTYYATVKDLNAGATNFKAVALSSSSLNGPWTTIGPVFPSGTAAGWHEAEEADPCPVFFGGRRYVLFAGWPGNSLPTSRQRIGIVEVDSNLEAIAPARIIVDPLETWQIGAQGPKVFSPRFFTGDGQMRLFYSQNPGVAASNAGWAYLTYNPNQEAPDPSLLFNSDFDSGFSATTKVEIYKQGTPNGFGEYLDLSTSPSSIIATSPAGELDAFTLVVDIDGAPTAATLRRLFSLSQAPDTGPVVGVWIDTSGYAYAEVKNGVDTNVILTTTTSIEGDKHRIVLRRKSSGEVEMFVDRASVATGTLANPIPSLSFIRMGNSQGYGIAAGQQVTGRLRARLYNEALTLDRLK